MVFPLYITVQVSLEMPDKSGATYAFGIHIIRVVNVCINLACASRQGISPACRGTTLKMVRNKETYLGMLDPYTFCSSLNVSLKGISRTGGGITHVPVIFAHLSVVYTHVPVIFANFPVVVMSHLPMVEFTYLPSRVCPKRKLKQ